MRLRVTLPSSAEDALKREVLQGADKVEEQLCSEQEWQIVCFSPSRRKAVTYLK